MRRQYELREITNGWLVIGNEGFLLPTASGEKLPMRPQEVFANSLEEALEVIRKRAKGAQ